MIGELLMKVADGWHRRQAVAIASTLPEEIEDARLILQLAMELLEGFMTGGCVMPEGDILACSLRRGAS